MRYHTLAFAVFLGCMSQSEAKIYFGMPSAVKAQTEKLDVTVEDYVASHRSNNLPVISWVTAVPSAISTFTISTVQCFATDADNDTLTYAWAAASGTLGNIVGGGHYVDWTPPDLGGKYLVTATVSDGNGGNVSQSAEVTVQGPSLKKWATQFETFSGHSSPALQTEGTIYIGGINDLKAFKSNGSSSWTYTAGDQIVYSPAIAADGTIYFGSYDHKVYALNPDGTLKWTFTAGNKITSSPAIAADGTIYVGAQDGLLYALNPTGTLKWSYSTGWPFSSNPAVASDGTIYFGSADLFALNPDGTKKWQFSTSVGGSANSSPAIGPDGTIYIGSFGGDAFAVNPNGTLKWSYSTGCDAIQESPSLAPDGTMYWPAGGSLNTVGAGLYALKSDGTLKWVYHTGYPVNSTPAIDTDGYVYFASGWGGNAKLYALTSAGVEKWSAYLGGSIESSPAIDSSGVIYIASTSSLYAIYGSGKLANSSWPKFHQNALNNGRIP